MIKEYEEIKNKLLKFKHLGYKECVEGTLVGKPSFLPEGAWLIRLLAPLKEEDILLMEEEKLIKIPFIYKQFLMNFSNGLDIFNGTLTFYGYRKHYNRDESSLFQPFALEITNVYERPEFSQDNYFYIGSYDWDGSKLYIDTITNHIHLCKRYDATSLYEWNSFEEMLSSEIDRIFSLFTDDGRQIDENQSTLPI